MAAGCTRRALLSSLALLSAQNALGRRAKISAERFRFSDPSTEFPVWRLTSPAHTSFLPPASVRAISRHDSFIVYWSDRTGSPQAYRMDPDKGMSEQLTKARDLDGRSLALLGDDRGLLYFDGPSLRHLELGKLREREIYRIEQGWQRGPGFSAAYDGSRAVWIERNSTSARIRELALPSGSAGTLFEAPPDVRDPLARPGSSEVLYRGEDDALWLSGRRLALAPGAVGPAIWSPDGSTVLYLSIPQDSSSLRAIREADPGRNTDQLIAPTSQYAAFAPNGDASVFVGASRSRAAPFILLLLRATRRELALAEHRSSDPDRVGPLFSPDSQRVYFHSDRHGKPAIYYMRVDRLVEATDS